MACIRAKRLVAAVVCALPCTTAAANAQEAEHVIEYRQAIMRSAGANMSAISIILKSRLMYQENLLEHARQLKRTSALFEGAFQNKVLAGRTDARPEIWSDWDGFLAIARDMGEESDRLADIGADGDLRAIAGQIKAIATSCGKCHRQFRKPKAESYKSGRTADLDD